MDENVRVMNDTEFGLYVRCLNHSWVNDGLPSDMPTLARALGRSLPYLKKQWLLVGKCFHPRESDPSRLENPRQELERVRAKRRSEQATDAILKRYGRSTDVSLTINNRRSTDVQLPKHVGSMDVSLRAYDSDYESRKGGVGENPKPVSPVPWGDLCAGDWAEKAYSRHPKAKNKALVERWYVQLWQAEEAAGRDPNILCAEIDIAHSGACRDPDWMKEKGRYAPPLCATNGVSGELYGWLPDEGWRHVSQSLSDPEEAAKARRFAQQEREAQEYLRKIAPK